MEKWLYGRNQSWRQNFMMSFGCNRNWICAVRWWILNIQQGFQHTCIEIKHISATASVKASKLPLKWLSVRFQFQVSATAVSGTWFWHAMVGRQSYCLGCHWSGSVFVMWLVCFIQHFIWGGVWARTGGVPSLPPPLPSFPHPSHSPTLPSPLPFPTSPLEVGHPARGSGERCKLPQRGLRWSPGRNWIWCILALKSDIWFQQI